MSDLAAIASSALAPAMHERRLAERTDVNEVAYIAGDGSSIRCHVVNISSLGAAIEVSDPSRLRSRFMLMLEKDRMVRDCVLVWQSDNRVGVSFQS